MQSAALLIVRKNGGYGGMNDRFCDLRVDDSQDPIAELRRLYSIWKPNMLVSEGYNLVEKGEFEAPTPRGTKPLGSSPRRGSTVTISPAITRAADSSEKAIETLSEALRLDPTLAKQTAVDTDLAPLRSDPRFGRMLEAATKSGRQRK